jgi:hypothetical protein
LGDVILAVHLLMVPQSALDVPGVYECFQNELLFRICLWVVGHAW